MEMNMKINKFPKNMEETNIEGRLWAKIGINKSVIV